MKFALIAAALLRFGREVLLQLVVQIGWQAIDWLIQIRRNTQQQEAAV